MATKLPHQRHESSWFREVAAATEDAILRSPGQAIGGELTLAQLDAYKRIVEHLDRRAFRLPAGLDKLLGADSMQELQRLLYDIHEVNESMAGETLMDAAILLNGSPDEREIVERGLDWARVYTARRNARSNPRDRGCPYRRFLRLNGEMVPRLLTIGGDGQDSWRPNVGPHLLNSMCRYVSWSFFLATWRGDVEWYDDGRSGVRRPTDVDPVVLRRCHGTFQGHSWPSAYAFDLLLNEMGAALNEEGCVPGTYEEETAAVEMLADDIHQMKPFIVRNFRPSKATLELPGGRMASFYWATGGRLGVLKVSNPGHESSEIIPDHFSLAFAHTGPLACAVNPWRTSDLLREDLFDVAPMTISRVALERVHERLFGFYDPIDVDAILERWRAAEPGRPTSSEEEDEVIAASIAVAARKDPDRSRARSSARIVSHLRLRQLRNLLDGRLGCTSRQGKGSELLFQRPGGRTAVVGRHKANPTVSAPGIRRILRRLGISVNEWLDATS